MITELWATLGVISGAVAVAVVYILVLFPEAILLDLGAWLSWRKRKK